MRSSEGIILKALVKKYHPNENLFKFFDPEVKERIERSPAPASTDFSSLVNLQKWIQPIHYSWFLPVIEKLSWETRSLLCALFPQEECRKIRSLLKIPEEKVELSLFLQPFLLHYLKEHLDGKNVLASELLPYAEMNALLRLNRKQVLHLIDLLGVYDLAADLRQVVDKEVLRKIYSALTQEQLLFLHYCSKQSMKWVPPSLGISMWDGHKKTLNTILHQRGIVRFARGLIGEDPHLLWHITRRLDSSRGKAVQKLLSSKQDKQMTSFFKSQILHLIKRYTVA